MDQLWPDTAPPPLSAALAGESTPGLGYLTTWYRALTLEERAGCLPAREGEPPEPGMASDLQQHRRAAWLAQEPFGSGSAEGRLRLEERLAEIGLERAELEQLLLEPERDLIVRHTMPPAWVHEIDGAYRQAFHHARGTADVAGASLIGPDGAGATAGLLELVRPLAEVACARLRRHAVDLAGSGPVAARILGLQQPWSPAHPDAPGLHEHPATHGGPKDCAESGPETSNIDHLVETLWVGVSGRVLGMISRTLVLELHVARLEGRLEGDTSEERFADFVRKLHRPAVVRALLTEYPVLIRQVWTTLDAWLAASAEMLDHLIADADAIAERFLDPARQLPVTQPAADPAGGADLGGSLGTLIAIETAGDLHRRGRSVRILRFSSGLRIVYKPRSLAVDACFQDLLTWLAHRDPGLDLRRIAVLDCGDHGWMEHVEAAECTDRNGAARFYHRLGALLGLLWVLEATDCHYENLIAAADHPVLVDLESLLHPRLALPRPDLPDLTMVQAELARSVLRVGLLPFRVGATGEFEGIDLSGTADVEGAQSPDLVLQWEDPGTDAMRATRQRVTLPGARNRPVLNGRRIGPLEHRGLLRDGFTRMTRLLLESRQELLAEGGLLSSFAEVPVRAVVRSTRGYHLLWLEGLHPDMLRDALDQDRLMDRLWAGIDGLPHLERTTVHERADLMDGDIPLFSCRPGARDLWTSTGERLDDIIDEPALDAVRHRLERLDQAELDRQKWLLGSAVATEVLDSREDLWPRSRLEGLDDLAELAEPLDRHTLTGFTASKRDEAGPASGPDPELRQALVDTALEVGEKLAAMAIRGGGRATWVGVEPSRGRWSLAPVGEDLYGGLPGIALALAYLGRIGNSGRHEELAREAVAMLLDRLDRTADLPDAFGALTGSGGAMPTADLQSPLQAIGAFQGLSGVLWTLVHLAALWNERRLAQRALTLLDGLGPRIPADRHLDLISGAAGCLVALLATWRATGRLEALDLAHGCGRHLLEQARPAGDGLGWIGRIETVEPPSGLSHGASGMAWALAELAGVTDDQALAGSLSRAAMAGFRYERGLLRRHQDNWLDLGDEAEHSAAHSGRHVVSMAWCYGAPGVGLARLASLPSMAAVVDRLDSTDADRDELQAVRDDLGVALRSTLARGFGSNHCLCHGDLGNLELIARAGRQLHHDRLRAATQRITRAVLDSIRENGPLCGTPLGVAVPGLMNGLAGIVLGLLRVAEPDAVPSVLLLDTPPDLRS